MLRARDRVGPGCGHVPGPCLFLLVRQQPHCLGFAGVLERLV